MSCYYVPSYHSDIDLSNVRPLDLWTSTTNSIVHITIRYVVLVGDRPTDDVIHGANNESCDQIFNPVELL